MQLKGEKSPFLRKEIEFHSTYAIAGSTMDYKCFYDDDDDDDDDKGYMVNKYTHILAPLTSSLSNVLQFAHVSK